MKRLLKSGVGQKTIQIQSRCEKNGAKLLLKAYMLQIQILQVEEPSKQSINQRGWGKVKAKQRN